MKFAVELTRGAQLDLADLHDFVARHDGEARAAALLDAIEHVLSQLGEFPNRGEYHPELLSLGIKQFRQVHHKPYRMIYQVGQSTVTVLTIVDGRRDLQTLLQRRLLY